MAESTETGPLKLTQTDFDAMVGGDTDSPADWLESTGGLLSRAEAARQRAMQIYDEWKASGLPWVPELRNEYDNLMMIADGLDAEAKRGLEHNTSSIPSKRQRFMDSVIGRLRRAR